jgi:hypothetical protein
MHGLLNNYFTIALSLSAQKSKIDSLCLPNLKLLTAIVATISMIVLIFIGFPSLFCKSDAKTFSHSSGISSNFWNCPPPSSEFRLNPSRILQNHTSGISQTIGANLLPLIAPTKPGKLT